MQNTESSVVVSRILADRNPGLPDGAVWQQSGRHPDWHHYTNSFTVPDNSVDVEALILREFKRAQAEMVVLIGGELSRSGADRKLVVLKNWWMKVTVVPEADKKQTLVFLDSTVGFAAPDDPVFADETFQAGSRES